MSWVAIKVVNRSIIGCVVGPFETEVLAQAYADKVVIGSLGHEQWLIRELQFPSKL